MLLPVSTQKHHAARSNLFLELVDGSLLSKLLTLHWHGRYSANVPGTNFLWSKYRFKGWQNCGFFSSTETLVCRVQSCSYSFPSLMKVIKQNVSSHDKKHLKITLVLHKLNSTLDLMNKLPSSVTFRFNRCKFSVQFLNKRLTDKLKNCSITKVIITKVYISSVSMFIQGLESVMDTLNNDYHRRGWRWAKQ